MITMHDSDIGKSGRRSTRLSSWDYGSNGKYFVTICTDHKVPYFGHLENSVVLNTEIGDYAKKCWESILIEFHWQKRYYDRIIRNDRELDQIREYIRDNPGKRYMMMPL